jgi:hypothetical protein
MGRSLCSVAKCILSAACEYEIVHVLERLCVHRFQNRLCSMSNYSVCDNVTYAVWSRI